MLPPATVRALTIPRIEACEFTPTKWSSAEDKTRFGNALLKFVANEFPRSSFTKGLYRQLSNTFGHIAHYDLHQFYDHFFSDDAGKIDFLEQTLQWPHFGDPAFTFSDVERIVQDRLRASNALQIFRMRRTEAVRATELAMLARLQQKYGAASLKNPPEPQQRQTDLFAE